MPIQNLKLLISESRRSAVDGPSQLQRITVARVKAMRMEFLGELWRQLRCWHQKRVASAQLHALDDAALRDIGLHRSGIEAALDRAAATSDPQKRRAFAERPDLCPQRTGAAV